MDVETKTLAPRAADEALGPAAKLVERAREYLDASLAPSTRRAYAAEWARFEAWCAGAGAAPFPVAEATLIAYVTREADARALAGVERALAAIVTVHKVRGAVSPRTAGVERLLEGIRRVKGRAQRQKAALTLANLRLVVAPLTDAPGDLRDRAALVLGFHAALRRSELLAPAVNDVEVVEVDGTEGLLLRLRGPTKTDQQGRGTQFKLGPLPEAPDVCPVATLKAWLVVRGGDAGPLFPKVTLSGWIDLGGRMSESTLVRRIKGLAADAGLDGDFGGHSLRAGFITTMRAIGVDDREIMRVTRHRNIQTLGRYDRPVITFADAPQRRMADALKGDRR